ncbi:hypothetical protein PCE1_001172 [Barthelona sp. PCE]
MVQEKGNLFGAGAILKHKAQRKRRDRFLKRRAKLDQGRQSTDVISDWVDWGNVCSKIENSQSTDEIVDIFRVSSKHAIEKNVSSILNAGFAEAAFNHLQLGSENINETIFRAACQFLINFASIQCEGMENLVFLKSNIDIQSFRDLLESDFSPKVKSLAVWLIANVVGSSYECFLALWQEDMVSFADFLDCKSVSLRATLYWLFSTCAIQLVTNKDNIDPEEYDDCMHMLTEKLITGISDDAGAVVVECSSGLSALLAMSSDKTHEEYVWYSLENHSFLDMLPTILQRCLPQQIALSSVLKLLSDVSIILDEESIMQLIDKGLLVSIYTLLFSTDADTLKTCLNLLSNWTLSVSGMFDNMKEMEMFEAIFDLVSDSSLSPKVNFEAIRLVAVVVQQSNDEEMAELVDYGILDCFSEALSIRSIEIAQYVFHSLTRIIKQLSFHPNLSDNWLLEQITLTEDLYENIEYFARTEFFTIEQIQSLAETCLMVLQNVNISQTDLEREFRIIDEDICSTFVYNDESESEEDNDLYL